MVPFSPADSAYPLIFSILQSTFVLNHILYTIMMGPGSHGVALKEGVQSSCSELARCFDWVGHRTAVLVSANSLPSCLIPHALTRDPKFVSTRFTPTHGTEITLCTCKEFQRLV